MKNPVLGYDQWSIKDACCAWREGVWYVFFSAFDQERSHLAAVRTEDWQQFSDLFHFDGQDEGYVGMCSPDVMRVGDVYVLTFNSWGDKLGRPNRLFYMQSSDLTHWSERRPLATDLTRDGRVIDAALAFAGDTWYLIYKWEQTPLIATAISIDGPWKPIGDGPPALLMANGRENDWDTFAAFVEALKAAPVEVEGDTLAYESPSIGRFVTGWDVVPTVGGEPIQLHGYPMVDSPWAHADFGSGELAIRYGDEVYEIWFNQ